jgi:hypothetical protein
MVLEPKNQNSKEQLDAIMVRATRTLMRRPDDTLSWLIRKREEWIEGWREAGSKQTPEEINTISVFMALIDCRTQELNSEAQDGIR